MLNFLSFPTASQAIATLNPSHSVLLFSKKKLSERIALFQDNFPGLVTYAVKSNPHPTILKTMIDQGLMAFDVASPAEIELLRSLAPEAALHYNNPIRSMDEIRFAHENNVRSYSVDCIEELEKLTVLDPKDIEVSIRLKLDLNGSAYHFGAKFGAGVDECVMLVKRAAELGFRTSMTFHVGTQCENPELYKNYVETSAEIAKRANVKLERLNVGGGFPNHRGFGKSHDYLEYFNAIKAGLESFEGEKPALVCEPGRGLVGDAGALIVKVKSLRKGDWLFLNDGIYGGLSEINLVPHANFKVYNRDGQEKSDATAPMTIYGPTCDSLDALHVKMDLPQNISEGDFVLFLGTGAYSIGVNTAFNGYGRLELIEVDEL